MLASEDVVQSEAATPLSTGQRGPVPKRRFQKGCFQIENGMAYSFYYADTERADGTLETRRVRHFIGRIAADGMSERAARREHDRIMQDVNLIWNDLSTRNSVLSFFFHSCSSQEAAQVAAGKL